MKRSTLLLAAMAMASPFSRAQTAPTAAQMAQMIVQRYSMVLGLSSTQGEEAVTIFTTEETTEATIRTAEQTAEKSLLTAIEGNDSSTIATVAATLGGLRGQEIHAQATAEAAFYAILTTEQQTRFAQVLEQSGSDLGGGPGGPPRR